MQSKKKIMDERMATLLFILCWIAYFTTYIGRLNYSSAMTEMIAKDVLNRSQAGTISMVFFFCYGGGQLVNGFLGDKFSSRMMIFGGLLISATANLFMGVVSSAAPMLLLWGINGYTQSMIWPPMVRIFSDMLDPRAAVNCSVNIASSMALGTLASYLLSAGMIAAAGWRSVFWSAAVIIAAAALLFFFGFRRVERFQEQYGVEPEEAPVLSAAPPPQSTAAVPFGRLLLCSGLLFVLVPVIVHGVLKDGVTSWVPTYISETFGASPVLSILVTMVLPVVNLTGAYAARFVNNRMNNETSSACVFFAVALAALVALFLVGGMHIALCVVLLSIITSSMLAVNTLFVNLVPMHFARVGKASTVSGFFNSSAYLGAAISTFSVGVLVERAGWSTTIFSWCVLTAAAFLLCLLVHKKPLMYQENKK